MNYGIIIKLSLNYHVHDFITNSIIFEMRSERKKKKEKKEDKNIIVITKHIFELIFIYRNRSKINFPIDEKIIL